MDSHHHTDFSSFTSHHDTSSFTNHHTTDLGSSFTSHHNPTDFGSSYTSHHHTPSDYGSSHTSHHHTPTDYGGSYTAHHHHTPTDYGSSHTHHHTPADSGSTPHHSSHHHGHHHNHNNCSDNDDMLQNMLLTNMLLQNSQTTTSTPLKQTNSIPRVEYKQTFSTPKPIRDFHQDLVNEAALLTFKELDDRIDKLNKKNSNTQYKNHDDKNIIEVILERESLTPSQKISLFKKLIALNYANQFLKDETFNSCLANQAYGIILYLVFLNINYYDESATAKLAKYVETYPTDTGKNSFLSRTKVYSAAGNILETHKLLTDLMSTSDGVMGLYKIIPKDNSFPHKTLKDITEKRILTLNASDIIQGSLETTAFIDSRRTYSFFKCSPTPKEERLKTLTDRIEKATAKRNIK